VCLAKTSFFQDGMEILQARFERFYLTSKTKRAPHRYGHPLHANVGLEWKKSWVGQTL